MTTGIEFMFSSTRSGTLETEEHGAYKLYTDSTWIFSAH